MNQIILDLIARVVEWCEPTQGDSAGYPSTKAVRVLAVAQWFLGEGTQQHSLLPTED